MTYRTVFCLVQPNELWEAHMIDFYTGIENCVLKGYLMLMNKHCVIKVGHENKYIAWNPHFIWVKYTLCIYVPTWSERSFKFLYIISSSMIDWIILIFCLLLSYTLLSSPNLYGYGNTSILHFLQKSYS